ncbi:MAG: hypothetical protein R3B13_16510 [Polyangiaceae bacterium]
MARGRVLVLAVIVALLGTSATIITMFVLSRGTERLAVRLVRFGLSCLLCFFLYRGASGARFLVVAFSGIAAFMSIVAGELPQLALGGIYVFTGATLVFSPSVSAYFRFKSRTRGR